MRKFIVHYGFTLYIFRCVCVRVRVCLCICACVFAPNACGPRVYSDCKIVASKCVDLNVAKTKQYAGFKRRCAAARPQTGS